MRDALAYGPKSPQIPYPPPIDAFIPELTVPGEDCLNLNIWSSDLGSAGQPVMVWIPGGMFEFHATGASPWYDGSRFARDGIVCVTINYRVGAEGFLYLGDGDANLGLLDQIAALKWVRENIAAFGGDPDNVSIFGESAGAMSVGTLLSMPCAEGLFRRAIAQSGAAHQVISAATAQRLKPDLFRQDLIALLDLLQQQKIRPLIAQCFPLAEARRAQELLGRGGVVGKIVLVRNGSSLESAAA